MLDSKTQRQAWLGLQGFEVKGRVQYSLMLYLQASQYLFLLGITFHMITTFGTFQTDIRKLSKSKLKYG